MYLIYALIISNHHITCSDKRLPQKPDSYEIKLHHVEMERLKKWEKMTKQWDSASTKEKLRRRIYKGIPNRFRGQVWTLLLGIKNLKREQAGKYEEMLNLARQWSTEIRQIDADVARQYRDHINYRYDTGSNTKFCFAMIMLLKRTIHYIISLSFQGEI